MIVTAGPTLEQIDPVRYISNLSTGRMGYSVAAAAAGRGFEVCLISGPVALEPPAGVEMVHVRTAREMRESVMARVDRCGCIVMAAAVCDFRPEKEMTHKIKKKEKLALVLVKNPDILLDIGKRPGLCKVGFALETENALENGRKKLLKKDLDLIVINIKGPGLDPFGPGKNDYSVMDRKENVFCYEAMGKKEMAEAILDGIERCCYEESP